MNCHKHCIFSPEIESLLSSISFSFLLVWCIVAWKIVYISWLTTIINLYSKKKMTKKQKARIFARIILSRTITKSGRKSESHPKIQKYDSRTIVFSDHVHSSNTICIPKSWKTMLCRWKYTRNVFFTQCNKMFDIRNVDVIVSDRKLCFKQKRLLLYFCSERRND